LILKHMLPGVSFIFPEINARKAKKF